MIKDQKIKAAVYGFIVGDALGVPYEFKARDTFSCTDMVGHGTWDQEKGTWSDDSSMVLATLDALSKKYASKTDLLASIMNNFLSWRWDAKYTAHNEVFDIGNTTAEAISAYCQRGDVKTCGRRSEDSNGNGALMRILPLAFQEYDESLIDDVAALTHNTTRSKFICEIYIKIVQSLINDTFDPFDPYLCMIRDMRRDQVKSTGYVIDSFTACLWCFLNSGNYAEAVYRAVNLGGDTDTIAALTGALAGIYYGLDDIPDKWFNSLANPGLIIGIVHNYLKSQDKST